jgi:hypothetical protein
VIEFKNLLKTNELINYNNIKLNFMKKSYTLFSIGSSLLFVLLGFYLIFEKSTQLETSNPILVKIVGISNVLLFGFFGILGVFKIIKK